MIINGRDLMTGDFPNQKTENEFTTTNGSFRVITGLIDVDTKLPKVGTAKSAMIESTTRSGLFTLVETTWYVVRVDKEAQLDEPAAYRIVLSNNKDARVPADILTPPQTKTGEAHYLKRIAEALAVDPNRELTIVSNSKRKDEFGNYICKVKDGDKVIGKTTLPAETVEAL